MLERDTFIVRSPCPGRGRSVAYAITDGMGEPLGRAVETTSTWTALLRPLLGRHALPTRIELRETMDDSLLAVLQHGGNLFHPRLEVRDAQGETVGGFASNEPPRREFAIHDREGGIVAHGDHFRLPCRFYSPLPATDLGSALRSDSELRVELNADLAEQPLTKLLILAAAFWLGFHGEG